VIRNNYVVLQKIFMRYYVLGGLSALNLI